MLNFGISSGCISHRTADILHRNSGHFAQNRGHFAQKQRTFRAEPRTFRTETADISLPASLWRLRASPTPDGKQLAVDAIDLSAYISGRVRVHFGQSPRTFRAFPLTLVGGTADYFVSHQPGFLEMLRFVRFFRFSRPLWKYSGGAGERIRILRCAGHNACALYEAMTVAH